MNESFQERTSHMHGRTFDTTIANGLAIESSRSSRGEQVPRMDKEQEMVRFGSGAVFCIYLYPTRVSTHDTSTKTSYTILAISRRNLLPKPPSETSFWDSKVTQYHLTDSSPGRDLNTKSILQQ